MEASTVKCQEFLDPVLFIIGVRFLMLLETLEILEEKMKPQGKGGSGLNFVQGCATHISKMVLLARPIFVKMIPLAKFYIKSAMTWHFLNKNSQIFALSTPKSPNF